ncbi:conserved hypothetical protein [Streptomyces misionensis JCM 4497]
MGQGPRSGLPVRLHRGPRGLDPGAADGGRGRSGRGPAAADDRDPERAGGTARPGPGPRGLHVRPAPAEGREHPGDRRHRHRVPRPRRARPAGGARGTEGARRAGSVGVPGAGRDGGLPRAEGTARLGRGQAAARAAAVPDHRHHRRERAGGLAGTRLLRGGEEPGPEDQRLPDRPDQHLRLTEQAPGEPDGPGAAPAGAARVRGAADAGRRVHRDRRAVRRRAARPQTGRAAPGGLRQPDDPPDRGGRGAGRIAGRAGLRHRLLPAGPPVRGFGGGRGHQRVPRLPRSVARAGRAGRPRRPRGGGAGHPVRAARCRHRAAGRGADGQARAPPAVVAAAAAAGRPRPARPDDRQGPRGRGVQPVHGDRRRTAAARRRHRPAAVGRGGGGGPAAPWHGGLATGGAAAPVEQRLGGPHGERHRRRGGRGGGAPDAVRGCPGRLHQGHREGPRPGPDADQPVPRHPLPHGRRPVRHDQGRTQGRLAGQHFARGQGLAHRARQHGADGRRHLRLPARDGPAALLPRRGRLPLDGRGAGQRRRHREAHPAGPGAAHRHGRRHRPRPRRALDRTGGPEAGPRDHQPQRHQGQRRPGDPVRAARPGGPGAGRGGVRHARPAGARGVRVHPQHGGEGGPVRRGDRVVGDGGVQEVHLHPHRSVRRRDLCAGPDRREPAGHPAGAAARTQEAAVVADGLRHPAAHPGPVGAVADRDPGRARPAARGGRRTDAGRSAAEDGGLAAGRGLAERADDDRRGRGGGPRGHPAEPAAAAAADAAGGTADRVTSVR